ncbi:3-phosphoglycerate dehydrogenase [Lachnoclostridium sp. An14]|uniref:phosphoglycerate dehydrogenase n=1 Tax=Lachnoclostridium sp. An14 TaxID=1965562 RepID=UPI000B389E5E|nr:phosphoglycerate dehydrogenase [Lachnoclostridium sp. An14]OUQ15558.1 3-phosphoglycerate dehydrogenase [Lachnoclostridium sp. An14]
MKRIHCLNAISKYGTDLLTGGYELTEQMDGADGVLVRSAAMHDMELPDSLLAIARAGAGVNNIPLDKCAEKGIVVFNTPGANANGVKELVLASLILASRDVIGGIQWCQSIKDDPNIAKAVEKGKKAFAGCEIRGKKLGVIGLGAIGVEVANAAAALGMTVYGYDPFISVNGAWMLSRDVKHIMTADDIYKECDYITLHVPLLDSTRGMISASVLQEMKDGVVVLNFSRDVLVDEDAMAEALNSGKVKKYITDFPNPKSANMAGAVVIPHLGASTEESEDNCAKMAVKEIMDYLENGNIRNSVNYPNCDMGVCRAVCRLTVLHRNIPNMIGQITAVLAAEGINISDMTNKSKDKFAYTMVDLEQKAAEEALERIRSIDGVLRVRAM